MVRRRPAESDLSRFECRRCKRTLSLLIATKRGSLPRYFHKAKRIITKIKSFRLFKSIRNLIISYDTGGISFSGTALDCWTQTENSLEKAKKLSALMGCPTTTSRDMIRCLRYRPARAIVQATSEFMVRSAFLRCFKTGTMNVLLHLW